jgi:hypothetical protein
MGLFRWPSRSSAELLCLEEILNVLRISHVRLSNFLQPDEIVDGRNSEVDTLGGVFD